MYIRYVHLLLWVIPFLATAKTGNSWVLHFRDYFHKWQFLGFSKNGNLDIAKDGNSLHNSWDNELQGADVFLWPITTVSSCTPKRSCRQALEPPAQHWGCREILAASHLNSCSAAAIFWHYTTKWKGRAWMLKWKSIMIFFELLDKNLVSSE